MQAPTGAHPSVKGEANLMAEPDAGFLPGRLRFALLIAGLLHGGLLLWAALMPPPQVARKPKVIAMDIIRRPKAPEPAPKTPEQVTPKAPEPAPKAPEPSQRPLPRELQPVDRPPESKPEASSPALTVPKQEPSKGPAPTGVPKGPVNLFLGGYTGLSGATGSTGPVPKAPNRLLKDERLDEKKEPEFRLEPEQGGGFKYDGKNFTGHISPDGILTFDDRFPIGVQRGGTFSFDLTDLVMKGSKQDPNAAEKRRFREFTAPLRRDLRGKKTQGQHDDALVLLNAQLEEIWSSQRPVAVRRRELFEKWSDAEETGKARRLIEEYVRRHLPAGTATAYTEEELRRFAQQREGQSTFNPYRGGQSASASTPPPSED